MAGVKNPKIALLSPRSGYIYRGVEIWSYELRRRLQGDVRVFSLMQTDWTVRVEGITRFDKAYQPYLWLAILGDRFGLWKIGRLLPWINVFGPWDLEEISYAWHLNQALQAFKPDIILNHGGPTVGLAVRLYWQRHRVPFITIGGAGRCRTEVKNARSQPDIYVAQTPSMKTYIEERAANVTVVFIPNGADLTLLTPSGPRFTDAELCHLAGQADHPLERPLVLSTSHFVPRKRLDCLIEAMARLQRGTLLFAGDGELRESLVQLGQQRLGSRFFYVGVLQQDRLANLYRTADVFCLPSQNEPFGNVLIEAMAANVPVVADDDEDRRWMVGTRGGVLTDVTDIDRLAQALGKAFQQDWGRGPRRQAERFGWDYVAEQYMKVIRRVLRDAPISRTVESISP